MTRVRVSDPGSLGELDEINVHFFWRRVYYQNTTLQSVTFFFVFIAAVVH